MPRPLSEEIDDAVREVECVKAALSSTDEDGEGYLGMRGHLQAERLALLQLLNLSLSSLDRLREKEIEVLKASTAAAAATGQQRTRLGVEPPLASVADASSGLEARRKELQISDVKSWVACRALLDSSGVGELRLVDSPLRRGTGAHSTAACATVTAALEEEQAEVDVFVWRLKAADAASVVRSMLNDETVSWDGEVSWPPRQTTAGGGQDELPGGPSPRGGSGGRSGGELSGPMAALKDRHLVGRGSQHQGQQQQQQQQHYVGRRRSFTADGGPAARRNSNSSGTGGVEYYINGVTRTMSPPLAMEMALRRGGGSSSFTGHSLPGQRMAGGSQGDVGEHQPRETRALSYGGHHGSGMDRAAEMGRPAFFSGPHVDERNSFEERFGGGGGGGGGGHGSWIGHHSNGYLANGGYANGNHATPNGFSNGRARSFSFRGAGCGGGGGGGGGGGDGDSRSNAVPPPPSPPPPVSPRSVLAGGGTDSTVLRHLLTFVAGDGFLFIAGVSRGWRDAWGVERAPETTIDAAVESPSRLGWARASGLEWGANVCARAAAGGHLATLRYARALKCPWDWRTSAHAATKALVPVSKMIQWAASQPAPKPSSSPGSSPSSAFVVDDPVRPRRLQVLQWCRENGCPWDEATASEAAREGNMDILRYARRNGCPWNVLTCAYAAASGNLETLKWAREEEGCGWNEATCAFAAAGGHLEVLKWVRSRGCPWGEEACASAARGGRLKVLQWCRSSGCPWGGGTCANAAEGGHLDVLKWARAQNCPWTEATCTLAAREGQFEILKWSRDNGCPWGSATFRAAAGSGNMDMLRFLLQEGCPWDRRTCASAARNSDLEALKFLRLNGCPWDSRTLDAAAERLTMDSRRLHELREVYTQLSQQSTGPDGAPADAAAAAPAPAGSPTPPAGHEPATPRERDVNNTNNPNSAGLSQGFSPTQPLTQAPVTAAGGGGSSAPPSGGAASQPALLRGTSFVSDSEHEGGGGAGAGAAAAGGKRKRKRSGRNSFYPGSYFEWTDELMANELPERANPAFVAAIFELGLKHSSPKVLMKLMPKKAVALTTEHIKSRLQKYRLHAQRSKEEFLEFFNLRLQAKFADFLQKEGWRKLSPEHGCQGHHDELEHDGGAGGGDGAGGGRGSNGEPTVKVDGQMVGDIRDLGAQCVREQFHLQEVLRQHISAQLKLQAEIHEHLTTAGAAGDASYGAPAAAASTTPSGSAGRAVTSPEGQQR
eukprot:g16367.t1